MALAVVLEVFIFAVIHKSSSKGHTCLFLLQFPDGSMWNRTHVAGFLSTKEPSLYAVGHTSYNYDGLEYGGQCRILTPTRD